MPRTHRGARVATSILRDATRNGQGTALDRPPIPPQAPGYQAAHPAAQSGAPQHAQSGALYQTHTHTHYTCQDCGHEWDDEPDPDTLAFTPCVDCGAPADLVIVYPPRYTDEGDARAPVCVDCALDVVDRTLDAVAELSAWCKAILQRQGAQGAPLAALDVPGNPPGNPPITLATASPQHHAPYANRAQRRAAMHRHKRTLRRGGSGRHVG